MWKEYCPGPPVTDSSTLAPSEVNANTELYMRIWSRNLTALLSLLVKRTSSSCGVAGRFGNRTLPFSQHKKNCGLLFVDVANHSLIHIFALQNPHIVSISPQSHRLEADTSSSPNNCNASLRREGYSRCLARRFFCRRLRRSCADSDVPWLNSAGTSICGTGFSKESVCDSFPALFCASAVCVEIVEVWLHQLKNCAGNATGVKMWGKINPRGGGGNESPWLINLYSLICSRHCWFLQRSQ